jgi:hypothetical protein
MNCTAPISWSTTFCAWRIAAPTSTRVMFGKRRTSSASEASCAGSTRNAEM